MIEEKKLPEENTSEASSETLGHTGSPLFLPSGSRFVRERRFPFGEERGIMLSRFFTRVDEDPLETVSWERRETVLGKGVEVPVNWSMRAAQAYVGEGALHGFFSIKKAMDLSVSRVMNAGNQKGYFRTEVDEDTFRDELTWLLLHQKIAFEDTDEKAASINLLGWLQQDGTLDIEGYKRAIEIAVLAQEIMVDEESEGRKSISDADGTRRLCLGYENLGGLLMSLGIAYDSLEGRAYAACLTALLCGHAFATSARISRDAMGPFLGYFGKQTSFLEMIQAQRQQVETIDRALCPKDLFLSAQEAFDEALRIGSPYGFRNAQVLFLKSCPILSWMMDCESPGIEPKQGLHNIHGGDRSICKSVVQGLERLSYQKDLIQTIISWIEGHGTIEGAPLLKPTDLSVFDCATSAQQGSRRMSVEGHLQMMAAVKPFALGAISMGMCLPHSAFDMVRAEVEKKAASLGLSSIFFYREGEGSPSAISKEEKSFVRRKLAPERNSVTHQFSISGHEGYIHVGTYEDGTPGEILIRMAKEGTLVSSWISAASTAVSAGLEHGIPLRFFVDLFVNTSFEPSGPTGNPEVPYASSVIDYVFRWLAHKFLPGALQAKQLDLSFLDESSSDVSLVSSVKQKIKNGERDVKLLF